MFMNIVLMSVAVDARLPHLERLSELSKDVRKVLMGYNQAHTTPNAGAATPTPAPAAGTCMC